MSVLAVDKKADLAGPGIGDYQELEKILPNEYQSLLNPKETQQAIFQVKRYIADGLCKELNLMMVEVPLIVDVESGVNDMLDRDGSRTPVQFHISNDRDAHPIEAQVVQAATKWKRIALSQFDCETGEGICTPYDQHGDYGRCAQNVASNFNGYVVYELPFGRGKQFGTGMNAIEDAALGGWRLSSGFIFHTGFAQTIFANADYSGTGGFSERANCVPGVSSKVPMTFDPSDLGVHFLNPAAVTSPAAGTFGNCPVGAFDGPGYNTANLGIAKDFRIREGHALEFRMDATNIANHPIFNFGQEYSGQHTAGASNYGEIFTSQGSRQIQLALRYHF